MQHGADGAPTTFEGVERAAERIRQKIVPREPRVGIVLGSGLGAFAEGLEDPISLPYADIPGFVPCTVSGHAGQVVAGRCGGVPVLVMQGRVHAYGGHSMAQIVLPVRAMIAAGCGTLLITNAAGGIRADLDAGDLVVITDQINLTGKNPLIGVNDERLGPRFPDMSVAYDPELGILAHTQAAEEGLALKEGVYCGVLGPSYETPAEVRMLEALGADLVGMSTVPEVIAANHQGARVLGISCVTNKAAGYGPKLSHDEVQTSAEGVKAALVALISRLVVALVSR